MTNLVSVQIRHPNLPSIPQADLAKFLEQRCNVQLYESWTIDDSMYVNLSPESASALLKWNGIQFAGQSLYIQQINNPPKPRFGNQEAFNHSNQNSQGTQTTIEMLLTFLNQRYDPAQKFLNLSGLAQDPYLIQNGLFSTASTQSKMFPAMMKIAQDRVKNVESVSLESNNLADVSLVTTLSQTYPNILNLSLANNAIANIEGLSLWKHKFRNLKQLILLGNPIASTPDYQSQIAAMFPRLMVLDNQQVRTEADLLAQIPKVPLAPKRLFFEDQGITDVAGPFLTHFFQLYDTDRKQLAALYDDQSTFSVSVYKDGPGSNFISHWHSYASRNLMYISNPRRREDLLQKGAQNIIKAFGKLPGTKHSISDPSKVAVDAYKVSGIRQPGDQCINLTLHGEFNEPSSKGSRSFDRVFVLAPGGVAGMIIVTDMLTVRPRTHPGVYEIAPNETSNGSINNANETLSEQQLQLVTKLSELSGLTPEYSRLCLEQANFDLEQGMTLFQQAQSSGSLPPEAFNRQ
ncbi:hypothetical protein CANCADRAFT_26747 [Tortispora caseinolytica NRRL Y-17796]|uniref:mRNA export factor MEX67 n=1 Tax=Tortispora caseinolytica NRRL Y-17796 TaxID=767744 RepID=A0A1E4TG61_9ASCO|nr:hypothetical protein CANCADRAFT_26747 [Tortispora caseinolytica NRRL Y-17796]